MSRGCRTSTIGIGLAALGAGLASAPEALAQAVGNPTGSRVSTHRPSGGGNSGGVASFNARGGSSASRVATVTGDRRFARGARTTRTRIIATRTPSRNLRGKQESREAPVVRVRRAGEDAPRTEGLFPGLRSYTGLTSAAERVGIASAGILATYDGWEAAPIVVPDEPVFEVEVIVDDAPEPGSMEPERPLLAAAPLTPQFGAPVPAAVLVETAPEAAPIISGGSLGEKRRRR